MSLRLSTIEEKKLADLYDQILEDMSAGEGGMFGTPQDSVDDLGQPNGDNYAAGDTRIPKSIFGGDILSRKGPVKKKPKKKKKNNI
jgi:hypothetical protein